MNFQFSDEQKQLADALNRWAEKNYTFEQRNATMASAHGTSAQAWSTLAELGVLALPLPAAADGFDGSASDMILVMQALGKMLCVEPVLPTLMAAKALQWAGQLDALKGVAEGAKVLSCAFTERSSRHDLKQIQTHAEKTAQGYVLNGCKTVVLHGAAAQGWVVSAKVGTEVALFYVEQQSAGISTKSYRTMDGQRAADIDFKNVHLPASAHLGDAVLMQRVADYGTALLCAEAVGVMAALHEATVEYIKTRQQFGQPIGRFQALQHKSVDMFMELEQARSMSYLACHYADFGGNDAENVRARAISASKARIGQAAKLLGQTAVQLHGGMGVTNELPAAHYFKRLTIIELTLGDTDHHLQRFASLPQFKQTA